MINFDQYLHRGYIWNLKYNEPVPFSNISFEEAKEKFWNKMDEIVEEILNLDGYILWTMSSGLDTSSILTHVLQRTSDIHTICLDNGRLDPYMSSKLANYWDLDNHKILEIDSDKIEPYLLEMNSIYKTPVSHTYLFFSYYLFKYTEEHGYKNLIMGDGPDVSMLGTHDLHETLITEAIRLGHYDLNLAKQILQQSIYPEYSYKDHNIFLMNSYKLPENIKYNDEFFYALWPREPYCPNSPKMQFKQNTLLHRIWAEWVQFIIRTRIPTEWFLEKFSFVQHSPYITMNDFIISLRPEYRYCLNSTKHLMREIYGDMLPNFIINKERTGFNPNDSWAYRYKDVIEYLLEKYLKEDKKIHEVISFPHEPVTFNQKWAMINLSMWVDQWL